MDFAQRRKLSLGRVSRKGQFANCAGAACSDFGGSLVLNDGASAFCLEGGDAVIACMCGGVHRAGADDFVVRRLQVEIGPVVGGQFSLIARIVGAVDLHRGHGLLGGLLGSVLLTAQKYEVFVAFQDEVELLVVALLKLKTEGHRVTPLHRLGSQNGMARKALI